MKIFKFSLFLTAVALFIFACSNDSTVQNVYNANKPAASSNAAATPASTPDELAAARAIYAEKCVACHKENGTGGKSVIDGTPINAENLTSDKLKNMADEKYVKYISDGIADEGMPSFKKQLTEEQIKSVIKFIRKEFQGK